MIEIDSMFPGLKQPWAGIRERFQRYGLPVECGRGLKQRFHPVRAAALPFGLQLANASNC